MIESEAEVSTATAAREADSDAWFTPGRFATLLAGLIFVTYPRVVIGLESFFYRDFGLFGYPLACYHRECFWRGELPLWNLYNNCGLPFLAQWNSLTLYPLSLFYLLLPLPWSLSMFSLGHLFLGGMGMYFLARHWTGGRLAACLAGTAYAFNGLAGHALMWPNNIAALGWMPWVVLTAECAWRDGGRRVVIAAFAGAMQMLAGAPEIILLTWVFAGAVWLNQFLFSGISRKLMLLRFSTVFFLVIGLAAAQLFPFLDLLVHSQRDTSFGGSAWAMPAWGWANFIVPLFHCSPSIIGVFSQNEQQWTSSYYMGLGALALAALAAWQDRRPRVWLLAGTALLGVLLAMGDNTPIYGWLKLVLPAIGIMRFPIKLIVLTVFTLPLLAAFAVNGNSALRRPGTRASRRKLVALGTLLLLVVVAILGYARRFPLPDESWRVTLQSGMSRAVFLLLILGGVWLFTQARQARTRALAGTAVLLLVALDALTHAPRQNPPVSTRAFGPLGIETEVRARFGESRAMVHPAVEAFFYHAATPNALDYYTAVRRSLYLNCNLPDDIPTTSGFFSLYLQPWDKVDSLLRHAPLPESLADFLGVSQISTPDKMFAWNSRTNFLPLATAGQKPVFANAEDTLPTLASPGFNPRATVYLAPEARPSITVSNASAPKIIPRVFSAQKILLDVEAEAPAMVVVAQSFYHCWHAYVDGVPSRIWPANYAFQALEVPAGHHQVKLVYEDRWFQLGAIISLVTLAGCVGGWFWTRKSWKSVG